MGHREKLKDGDEVDAIYGKHIYVYLNHSQVAHRIKKRLSRRNRREVKQECKYGFFQ